MYIYIYTHTFMSFIEIPHEPEDLVQDSLRSLGMDGCGLDLCVVASSLGIVASCPLRV